MNIVGISNEQKLEALKGLGDVYVEKRIPDTALSYYDEIIDTIKKHNVSSKSWAQVLIGKANAVALGDSFTARHMYLNVIEEYGDMPHALNGYGSSSLKEGEYLTAEKQFNKVIEMYEKEPGMIPISAFVNANLGLAELLVYEGKSELAIQKYDKIFAIYGETSSSLMMKALALIDIHEPSKAIIVLKKALSLDEYYNADIYLQLGKLYKIQGDYDDALDTFKKGRALIPNGYVDFDLKIEEFNQEISELRNRIR